MVRSMPRAIDVVLIDSNRIMLWGLEKMVESAAPRMKLVGAATSSTDGLEAVRRSKPDVVVIDIELRGENGVEAIPQLISAGAGRILVLTALRDAEMHDQAVMAGAHGIVAKEQSPSDIVKAIEKVHGGELWLDRISASRVIGRLSNGGPQKKVTKPAIPRLTAREKDVIRAVVAAEGAPTKKIAARMDISDRTLRNHLTVIYSKLGVVNRLELLHYVSKRQLLSDD